MRPPTNNIETTNIKSDHIRLWHLWTIFRITTCCSKRMRIVRAGLKPIEPFIPDDGVIYSWKFKYTQQQSASFYTENSNLVPAPTKVSPACLRIHNMML